MGVTFDLPSVFLDTVAAGLDAVATGLEAVASGLDVVATGLAVAVGPVGVVADEVGTDKACDVLVLGMTGADVPCVTMFTLLDKLEWDTLRFGMFGNEFAVAVIGVEDGL